MSWELASGLWVRSERHIPLVVSARTGVLGSKYPDPKKVQRAVGSSRIRYVENETLRDDGEGLPASAHYDATCAHCGSFLDPKIKQKDRDS